MKLTVVGCSGSFPSAESACSSYLVEADGFRLLIDMGKAVKLSQVEVLFSSDGGPTTACNLGPLCVKHHRRKSRRLWDIKQTGDGRFEVTSPLGATQLVQPEPVDDHWDLPDDLYDWTEEAEFAEWSTSVPPPEPHWAYAIDRPDEPEFRRDADC